MQRFNNFYVAIFIHFYSTGRRNCPDQAGLHVICEKPIESPNYIREVLKKY